MSNDPASPSPTLVLTPTSGPLGLGLDVGGTTTRWALAAAQGPVVLEGQAPGFSGLQLATDAGRGVIAAVLAGIARSCQEAGQVPQGICAGVTGFDGDQPGPLRDALAQAFGVPGSAVLPYNDIELACRTAFAPGGGILVYAGTGSVAAHLDARGVVHRAGGRGGLIDDGGSGYWLAREALRAVWRLEDERPGAGLRSALGRALSQRLGGATWSDHRGGAYGASRGELGALALAVAEAAREGDAQALALLASAGDELARLARALLRLHGHRPVRLAGRVFELHPEVERALRWALPGVEVQPPEPMHAHRRAAALAAALTPTRSGAQEGR